MEHVLQDRNLAPRVRPRHALAPASPGARRAIMTAEVLPNGRTPGSPPGLERTPTIVGQR